eukprot:m.737227 g.737227  ORF g.737227 m.737227 type:complete len:226 (+) comp58904_c0_seq9:239-916(+)
MCRHRHREGPQPARWRARGAQHHQPCVRHCHRVPTPGVVQLNSSRSVLRVVCIARSRKLVEIGRAKGWKGIIAGTRKTTPGFRLVEKYAMKVGGADAHRMDLSSMVMIKDNHIASRGSITEAVKAAVAMAGYTMKIEVEVANADQAFEAIEAGAHVIMLDNNDPISFAENARRIKLRFPHIIVEGSGGLNEACIADYMVEHVDVLSTSSIHQGVRHSDFSLKIVV